MPPAIRGSAMATSVPMLSVPAAAGWTAASSKRVAAKDLRISFSIRLAMVAPNCELFRLSGLDVDIHAVGRTGIIHAAHGAHIDAVGRDAVLDQHLANGQS